MICLDTSFLLEYLDGSPQAKAYLEERSAQPFFAPALVLFELYRGAARTSGPDGVDRLVSSLDWIHPLALTDETAREAALVEAELLDRGEAINLGDVLIAGVCRAAGATLVTHDRDFERVADLDVEFIPIDSTDE